MNEIQQTKEDIAILLEKLEKLEELEELNSLTLAERAYKKRYGHKPYPCNKWRWFELAYNVGYDDGMERKHTPSISISNGFFEGNLPNGFSSWTEFFEEFGRTGNLHGVKISTMDFNEMNEEEIKSPIEEAYKKVYGEYPPTTPSVSNSEDERWSNFQKDYNASKEEYKVEEEPEPENLYWALTNLGYSDCSCDEIADAVEELFLPDELMYDGDGEDYAYERGWNDAIKTMKRKLR